MIFQKETAQKDVVQHTRFSERALEEKWRRFRRLLNLFDTSLPGISTVQVMRFFFVNRSERTGKGYQLFAMDRDTAVRVRIVQWILPPISVGIRPGVRLYLKISFLDVNVAALSTRSRWLIRGLRVAYSTTHML